MALRLERKAEALIKMRRSALLRPHSPTPAPELLVQKVWGVAWDFAFLCSVAETTVLGPHFENHYLELFGYEGFLDS